MPDAVPRNWGSILGWRPRQAGKWYFKNVAVNPLVMGLIQGPLGYMAGRHLAAPLTEYFSPSPSEEAKQRRQRMFALLGLGAGLLPPALMGAGRWMEQYDIPTLERALVTGMPPSMAKIPGSDEGLASALLRPFYKEQSVKEAYVPAFPGTQNIIMADPILSPYEKAVAVQSVANALEQSDKQGLFTVGDLVRGAIGAGLGYGGARLAGTLLGRTFGLSPNVQKRIGQVGAVGGILANTGILRV